MASVLAIFYFASSGASAASLTVSEIFPMESRALSIAFFYAVGTGLGGIVGPLLFGELINTGDLTKGKTPESIAEPLSAAGQRIGGTEVGSGQEPPGAMV